MSFIIFKQTLHLNFQNRRNRIIARSASGLLQDVSGLQGQADSVLQIDRLRTGTRKLQHDEHSLRAAKRGGFRQPHVGLGTDTPNRSLLTISRRYCEPKIQALKSKCEQWPHFQETQLNRTATIRSKFRWASSFSCNHHQHAAKFSTDRASVSNYDVVRARRIISIIGFQLDFW